MEGTYGQMGLMYDNDIFSVFPGKWLTDQVHCSCCGKIELHYDECTI